MDCLHYGGMNSEEELSNILRTKEALGAVFRKEIKGWLSPAKSQSESTPDLLAKAGFEFMMDWVNDELPYEFRTKHGVLHSFPVATEWEDRFTLMHNQHSEQSWLDQIYDAYHYLAAEAKEEGGRMLTLSIHPWLMGQAHRIKYLEALLEFLSKRDDVWFANAEDIISVVNG